MKYIICILTFGIVLSCNTSQEAIIASQKTLQLKGEWSLDKISYDRSGIFEVTLYNDASTECMTGGIWKFIPNNNTGKYTVNEEQCNSTGARDFRFSIPGTTTNGNYSFLLKPISQSKISINENKGYRMTLEYLDEKTMTWTQTVSLEGKPFVITMNFNKLK